MAESGLNLLDLIAADTLALRKATHAITTNGPDVEFGDGGRNTIRGLGGNDELFGLGGNDRLFGGADADELTGGAGRDRLFGGSDDDILYGSGGGDRFYGGTGEDELNLNGGSDRVHYDVVNGNQGRDTVIGFDIGTDMVLLKGYEIGNNALQLTSSGGNAVVTLRETGQQIVFEGISATTLADNALDIFLAI